MTVVAIFSGPFCGAEAVAKAVAERQGCPLLGDELLVEAATAAGLSPERLFSALCGHPSFFAGLTHEVERSQARVREALARHLAQTEALVYQGPALHFIPRGISHVLRVCLVARSEFRVRQAEAQGLAERKARKAIDERDQDLGRLTHGLFGKPPWDPTLYDMKIPMHDTTIPEAAALIAQNAARPVLEPTPESRRAVAGMGLAARVLLRLQDRGHFECDVYAKDEQVTVLNNREVLRLEALEHELMEAARSVEGVKEVLVKAGPRFNQTDSTRRLGSAAVRRVLLVDDEQEYVLTLSERLRIRDIASDVVHTGEDALSYVDGGEPEVMVLDLRMPGIDGLEVLRRVKHDHPRVEVIILTGHGNEKDRQMALELGAFAYLQKPVDIDILAKTMKEAAAKIEDDRRAAAAGEPAPHREHDDGEDE